METKFEVLDLLGEKKNVLLTGAPGTGKSMVLNAVAETFEKGLSTSSTPTHIPGAPIPVPVVPSFPGSPMGRIFSKTYRKVFRTTLHQNSKYRDFISGIVPNVNKGSDGPDFVISQGILYKANEFAKGKDSAALVIIDELNRGPAIEVFGGSIVAIESDKRLADNGSVLPTTQFFTILNPNPSSPTDTETEYAFSQNLYILAAMNQADASVAPLDVAFLRRWQSYPIDPNYQSLVDEFHATIPTPLPTLCSTAEDALVIAIESLKKINRLISIGRGDAFQIGQGIYLSDKPAAFSTKDEALTFLAQTWPKIYAHIEELFFGDVNSIGFLLNAGSPESPYEIKTVTFAGEDKLLLTRPSVTKENVFQLLHAITEIKV